MLNDKCDNLLAGPTVRSRRDFLKSAGCGFGSIALSAILGQHTTANELQSRQSHFAGKARSVIWLFMHGGPSQIDTWDYKPELQKRSGQTLAGFDQSTGFFAGLGGPIMRSPFRFQQHGDSGKWVSEIYPNLSQHVDEMAFIHSGYAHENNHSPAQFQMNTGMSRMGFPCVGSWVTYGLGTQNQNLPGFVVMYDGKGRGLPKSRASAWGAGYLPGVFQGTAINSGSSPIANLKRLGNAPPNAQRKQLDFIQRQNQRHLEASPQERELAARIESFELAYRMQMAAPEAIDLTAETAETHKAYGLDDQRCSSFGRQALVARRLVERGVRFVQLYSGGFNNADCWDGHTNIDKNHRQFAGETDQPISALLADLKQRGLLDSTLVVCCGEFGRLPLVQKGGTGRDHNPHAFTIWLAGGGTKAGARYGSTDEIGYKATENKVSIHDLHATILHILGLDHEQLTYRHNGRDFRLTDVAGRVVHEVLS